MSEKSSLPLKLPPLLVESAVAAALEEDLGTAGDITTDAIVPADAQGEAAIVARQAGVVAGLDLAEAAFRALDPDTRFVRIVEDGGRVAAGGKIASITAKT
ncbi:MAG: carboxylating nicotinate-nucleotide diphosphorylase, partial [Methyloceanibacter sp.]